VEGAPDVVDTTRVFRFVREPNPLFTPDGRRLRLPSDAFSPSSDDEAEAKARGFAHPRLSVFDAALTTVTQARRIQPSGKSKRAYALQVADMKSAAAQVGYPPIRVVRDPLPITDGPGRRGHCLIVGMTDKTAAPRPLRKALLDELDQRCYELTDMDCPRSLGRRLRELPEVVAWLVHRRQ
jgi:hypothetical protein